MAAGRGAGGRSSRSGWAGFLWFRGQFGYDPPDFASGFRGADRLSGSGGLAKSGDRVQQKGGDTWDLVGAVYEAALQPELWDEVLAGIEGRVRADSSILYLQDLKALDAPFEVARGLDRARLKEYYRHYINLDPMFAYRMEQPVGTVTASHQLVPDGEFERTEFYQGWFRHLGRFYYAGGVIARENDRVAVVGVQRAQRAGPFNDKELRQLRAIFPHLERSFQIGRLLANGESQRQAVMALLERLPSGVLLLDAQGRVVFLNRRAQVMLAAEDGLTITAKGLVALDPEVNAALGQLIEGALRTGAGEGLDDPALTAPQATGGALLVPGREGREGCHVLATPLRANQTPLALGPDRICAALFLQFEGSPPALSQEVLRELFGLTVAEARVAMNLAHGRSPDEIAAVSETSRYTVRSQLSSIYSKMGVSRQAEVVQRVLSSPAVLGDDGN